MVSLSPVSPPIWGSLERNKPNEGNVEEVVVVVVVVVEEEEDVLVGAVVVAATAVDTAVAVAVDADVAVEFADTIGSGVMGGRVESRTRTTSYITDASTLQFKNVFLASKGLGLRHILAYQGDKQQWSQSMRMST